MLVCQHDLAFVRPVDLPGLVRGMARRPDIRHVRFNKTENAPTTWDGEPAGRRRFFTEEVLAAGAGDIRLTRTIGWSDNNHLCRADYYRHVILPLVRDRCIHPEHAANLAASPRMHDLLGTYIFGGLGEPPVLHHLDGRGRGATTASQHAGGLRQALRRLARTNRTRVSVGVDRIVYKVRIRRIRRKVRSGVPTTPTPR